MAIILTFLILVLHTTISASNLPEVKHVRSIGKSRPFLRVRRGSHRRPYPTNDGGNLMAMEVYIDTLKKMNSDVGLHKLVEMFINDL